MKKASLEIAAEDVQTLQKILRCPTSESREILRAKIILGFADNKSGYQIAKELEVDFHTVNKWRKRYSELGLAGLKDAYRSGQPSRLEGDKVKEILDKTMHCIPKEATHWSLRLMSKYVGVSVYLVSKVWKAADLKPHLRSTFNFSKDPDFADKVIDIIGLYMAPPVDAIVLSVDEKTQIQALDHTQPLLQLAPHQIEKHTHDYIRNGTTSLYAAFDIATGRVIGKTNKRHRAKEFISFLNLIDNRMRSRKNKENIHIILDNSSTHKTKEVKEWLKAHPNYHFHFTPTSSSWLNAVENWFSRLERKGLQRKAFQSVKQLREHLRQFIVTYNKHSAKPFVWKKPAQQILDSVERAKQHAAAQTSPTIL